MALKRDTGSGFQNSSIGVVRQSALRFEADAIRRNGAQLGGIVSAAGEEMLIRKTTKEALADASEVALERNENGHLVKPETPGEFGPLRTDVWEEAVEKRYYQGVQGDVNQAFADAHQRFPDDTQAANANFDAIQQAYLAEADPAIRGDLDAYISGRRASHFGQIARAERAKLDNIALAAGQQEITTLQSEATQLAATGEFERSVELSTAAIGQADKLLNDGIMSAAAYDATTRRLRAEIATAMLQKVSIDFGSEGFTDGLAILVEAGDIELAAKAAGVDPAVLTEIAGDGRSRSMIAADLRLLANTQAVDSAKATRAQTAANLWDMQRTGNVLPVEDSEAVDYALLSGLYPDENFLDYDEAQLAERLAADLIENPANLETVLPVIANWGNGGNALKGLFGDAVASGHTGPERASKLLAVFNQFETYNAHSSGRQISDAVLGLDKDDRAFWETYSEISSLLGAPEYTVEGQPVSGDQFAYDAAVEAQQRMRDPKALDAYIGSLREGGEIETDVWGDLDVGEGDTPAQNLRTELRLVLAEEFPVDPRSREDVAIRNGAVKTYMTMVASGHFTPSQAATRVNKMLENKLPETSYLAVERSSSAPERHYAIDGDMTWFDSAARDSIAEQLGEQGFQVQLHGVASGMDNFMSPGMDPSQTWGAGNNPNADGGFFSGDYQGRVGPVRKYQLEPVRQGGTPVYRVLQVGETGLDHARRPDGTDVVVDLREAYANAQGQRVYDLFLEGLTKPKNAPGENPENRLGGENTL